MQDEPIDDIIREAANGYTAPFDEGAWVAMRQKLAVHLPQKNRKGRFLLLLLLLVVGSTAAYVLLKTDKGKDKEAAATIAEAKEAQTGQPNSLAAENSTADLPGQAPVGTVAPSIGGAVTQDVPQAAKPVTTNQPTDVATERGNPTARPVAAVEKQSGKNRVRTRVQSAAAVATPVETDAEAPNEDLTAPVGTAPTVEPKDMGDTATASTTSLAKHKEKTTADPQDSTAKQPLLTKLFTDTAQVGKTATAATHNKKGIGSHLALLLSAGADMSYVRLSNRGKTTLVYGAGLGYTIGKRWMVRAGVYSVEKIYAANKADYSLPPQAANNPYLYQIDGRCRVLEIPVGVTYAFAGQKQHRWFAGAGLASVLMKTEQYDYQYKSATGVQYTRSYGVSNENKHYLAILSLSAGYQYQVGKRFSLLAEPYWQLPLNGVGMGKVKLQSVGMLVTVAIKPFAGK